MNFRHFKRAVAATLAIAVLAGCGPAPAAEPAGLRVLPKAIDSGAPSNMMKRYLLKKIEAACGRWRKRYEQLKTPRQIAEYQKRQREFFARQLGDWPKRTPLNPQVVGKVARPGFTVEKIIFESQPKHFVTAALFLPDPKKHKPPFPGVLVPCGHSRIAKACDPYQRAAALLALNGMAALVFDPIDQGERAQLIDRNGRAPMWGTKAHTMVGVGSILLGRNTAWFEVWDGMRAIDYLQSRKEVDPKRIGCTGNSGGGTQTSYLMAIDKRIVCAAPSCYLTSFLRLCQTIGPADAEQNIFSQAAFGMGHADYILMRAPKPTLICCATRDFFDISGTWDTFRNAKRVYTRLGFAERMDLVEDDNKHGFHLKLREGMVRWMMRWLLDRNQPVTEPKDLKILTEAELRCTPKGEVMLLDGARSTYDINDAHAAKLAKQRTKLWQADRRAKTLEKVRELVGVRTLAKLPKPTVDKAGTVQRDGYHIEKFTIRPEDRIYLPALLFVPKNKKASVPPVLYIHERGKSADAAPGGPIEKLIGAGRIVLAVDLRGIGETAQMRQRKFTPHFGPDWQDSFAAYMLGRSFVGMRAEDVLLCARWLAEQQKDTSAKGVALVAVGHVGVPALHAAALEPKQFPSVKLARTLVSWSNVIQKRLVRRQLINTVHGALEVYDLPDLTALLGRKLTIVNPLDATGQPIRQP